MIVIRNCFTAKPGQATKLAKLFKDVVEAVGIPNARVLTDVTGGFNTVVFEYAVENLAAVDTMMQQYMTDPVMKEKMAGYTDLWMTGHREVLKVV